MSLCINPHCQKPQNPDNILFCQHCGSELLLEGRYRAISQLGGGGFGKTYEVSDRTGTPKVLKVLIDNHPKAVELFQREAEVLSLLHHPGIPRVESNGYFVYFLRNSTEPLHCLVMEKIEGLDLHEYLRQRGDRPINEKLAVQWLTEVVTILQQVHQQNFFHRDIKPSNVMLRADGRLALIDFGTARAVTGTYMAKQVAGQVTGIISAGYTPPEQFNGQAVQQSDFFALGRTIVYLLTAKEPSEFYDPLTEELRWRTSAPQVSPLVADFLDRLMARLPSQRPPDAQVILQQLVEIDRALNPSQARSIPTQPVNTPGVAPTQQASTPQLSVSSLPTQPVNTPGVARMQQARTSQPPPYSPPPVPFQYRVRTPSGPQPSHPSCAPALAERPQVGWGFWLQWVLATAFGGTIGWAVGSPLSGDNTNTVLNIVVGTLVGTSVGIGQWLVLRRQVSRTGWWVLATAVCEAVSLTLSTFLFLSLYQTMARPLVDSFYEIAIGTSVGIGQWLVLRRQVSRTGWWVLATAVGETVGGVVGWGVVGNFILQAGVELFVYGAVSGAVAGTVSGAITGIAMVWLLRHSVPQV